MGSLWWSWEVRSLGMCCWRGNWEPALFLFLLASHPPWSAQLVPPSGLHHLTCPSPGNKQKDWNLITRYKMSLLPFSRLHLWNFVTLFTTCLTHGKFTEEILYELHGFLHCWNLWTAHQSGNAVTPYEQGLCLANSACLHPEHCSSWFTRNDLGDH